jgi:hypothetical protein
MPTKTTITLTIDDEDGGHVLGDTSASDVYSILNDALKEYAAKREPAREYVAERYGYPGSTFNTPDKVRSVERRNRLAIYMTRSSVTVTR